MGEILGFILFIICTTVPCVLMGRWAREEQEKREKEGLKEHSKRKRKEKETARGRRTASAIIYGRRCRHTFPYGR